MGENKGQEIQEEVVRQGLVIEAHDGQEVLLGIEGDAVVGLAVHVDGQIRNRQKRTFKVHKAGERMIDVAAF